MERKTKAVENSSAPKKARILRKQKPPKQKEAEDDGKAVHVCLDPDTLECPLCFYPFEAAIFQSFLSQFVYQTLNYSSLHGCTRRLMHACSFCDNQCKNGHAACEACCSRIKGTCASCGEPIGEIRCRPLENAIAAMTLPCAFTGCTRRLKFAEKWAHEALLCPHAPCTCPIHGAELHDHILMGHAEDSSVVTFVRSTGVALRRDAPFRVLLDARVFLLVNGGEVPMGRALSVVCLGPRPPGNRVLEYKMDVSAAALSLSASGPVPCVRRWAAGHHPGDVFLFVPDACWSSFGCVDVTVEVKKPAVDKV